MAKLSYTSTPRSAPYIYKTFVDTLRELAEDEPDRTAFVFYDLQHVRSSLTRKELLDKATESAKKFVKMGVVKGTHVGVCMNNSFEMLILQTGLMMAGGIAFYFHTNLKDGSDVINMLNALKGELLIMDASPGDVNWNILDQIWPTRQERCSIIPSLKTIMFNGNWDPEIQSTSRKNVAAFFAEDIPEGVTFPQIQPEDTLVYLCTSGSTGVPKVVMYTHYSTMNWTKQTNARLGITGHSVWFCERTFSWAVGYPRTYLTDGTTRVFVDTRMTVAGKDVGFVADIIEKESCDAVTLPGYMAVDLTGRPELGPKFKNVKMIQLLGERVLKASVDKLQDILKCNQIMSYYGTTEHGAISSYITSVNSGDFEDGIVGEPLDGLEMKVVDDSGLVVPVGTSGELLTRATWRFAGYWGLTDQPSGGAVDALGWFHTGDIGHMRSDGNFVIDGRLREMVSTGSMKFFPWSTEKILKTLPGAATAFAVGVPDKRLKEVICACVVPKPESGLTAEDLEKFCSEKFVHESTGPVVGLKPKYHVLLDSVPLLASGKVNRRKIAEIAKEKLGLSAA
ncbi:3-[(3aS,4S,7aS)-7a-methyl-1,5-dioxo-octahydro-1H-inden-4-yl]propanoyl:CoA ligase-like [Mya arenaria]|uniref:3-[(3aS,4S,7aS)-7a-methyl-1, 5-dioxo-octahydro-1H-inden-4-yl]propanoyl:CoA ligase-like n=1 Tax=Mya arenaria TaxID=6604 RepID=UPI0022E2476E|nr:3-[(3aS,4S,7aS)-7a-methyl-1,5-dioxo-octahydro-1H-inden-4-yl]propanoyl:CoA ligase-like [Mya arenaria]